MLTREDIYKPPPPDARPDLNITGILEDTDLVMLMGLIVIFTGTITLCLSMMIIYQCFCLRAKELDKEALSELNREQHVHPRVMAQRRKSSSTAEVGHSCCLESHPLAARGAHSVNPLSGGLAHIASHEAPAFASLSHSLSFTSTTLHRPSVLTQQDESDAWKHTFRQLLGSQEGPERTMRAIHAITSVPIASTLEEALMNAALAIDLNRSGAAALVRSAMEQYVPSLFTASTGASSCPASHDPRVMESLHTRELTSIIVRGDDWPARVSQPRSPGQDAWIEQGIDGIPTCEHSASIHEGMSSSNLTAIPLPLTADAERSDVVVDGSPTSPPFTSFMA